MSSGCSQSGEKKWEKIDEIHKRLKAGTDKGAEKTRLSSKKDSILTARKREQDRTAQKGAKGLCNFTKETKLKIEIITIYK